MHILNRTIQRNINLKILSLYLFGYKYGDMRAFLLNTQFFCVLKLSKVLRNREEVFYSMS